MPGLRVAVPATPQDAWWQLRQAIRSDEPNILLEHELLYFAKGSLDMSAEVVAGLTERAFFSLDAVPERVAARDIPTPYNGTLEAASIPRPADIVHAAKQLCAKGRQPGTT